MKPGPLISALVADTGQVEVRHDLLGHLARRHAEALGERKCHVRLEVRELRGADERIGAGLPGAEGSGDRRAHPFRENLLRIGHGNKPIGGRGPVPLSRPALGPRTAAVAAPAGAGATTLQSREPQERRRKWRSRPGPNRSLIFSVIWPWARSAASRQADVIPLAVDAPCAITTVPSSPSSAAPP